MINEVHENLLQNFRAILFVKGMSLEFCVTFGNLKGSDCEGCVLRCDAIDYAKIAESPVDTEALGASETPVFLPDLQALQCCATIAEWMSWSFVICI